MNVLKTQLLALPKAMRCSQCHGALNMSQVYDAGNQLFCRECFREHYVRPLPGNPARQVITLDLSQVVARDQEQFIRDWKARLQRMPL